MEGVCTFSFCSIVDWFYFHLSQKLVQTKLNDMGNARNAEYCSIAKAL